MAKNKNSEKKARIILALIGIGLMLWNLNTICLYLLGEVTPAYDIVVSRQGSRYDSTVGSEYRFSVSYKYNVDGVSYDGLNTGLRGSRLGIEHDNTVHYYPFAPKISSLFAESAASFGMLLTCGFSLTLILLAVILRKGGKDKMSGKKKQKNEAEQDSERVTMAWLMENNEGYDDALEEYYQNGWDEGDPSWECSCGKWNTENFCESCGRPRSKENNF